MIVQRLLNLGFLGTVLSELERILNDKHFQGDDPYKEALAVALRISVDQVTDTQRDALKKLSFGQRFGLTSMPDHVVNSIVPKPRPRFTLPDKPMMPLFDSGKPGADEVEPEPVKRWCQRCRANTTHLKRHPAALLTCVRHPEERVDQDTYDLMCRQLIDTIDYNTELRARNLDLQRQIAQLQSERTTPTEPAPPTEEDDAEEEDSPPA